MDTRGILTITNSHDMDLTRTHDTRVMFHDRLFRKTVVYRQRNCRSAWPAVANVEQIRSTLVTVSNLYTAVGINDVGTLVAIDKDAEAPNFEVALFTRIPELEAALRTQPPAPDTPHATHQF